MEVKPDVASSDRVSVLLLGGVEALQFGDRQHKIIVHSGVAHSASLVPSKTSVTAHPHACIMSGAQDPRFAGLKTDPRFRRPKQKQLKVEIDERFRDVLESEEFGGKGTGKGKGKRTYSQVFPRCC